ncbi:MAG: helix-turn-helix transcriptional regulator [Anaeromyxobacteraceae bacterium]
MEKDVPRATRSDALKVFGASLRDIRRANQKTQVQLARELGVSVSYVSLLERGERNPPLSRLIQIAQVLDTTPVRLVETISRPQPLPLPVPAVVAA